ncbi:MAG: T9SS type A sorting domain-containing protein [Lewinellaceae bacterium]|nr:T9SS type A sorting domain-containing protein [Lewinellaceae bacterium]
MRYLPLILLLFSSTFCYNQNTRIHPHSRNFGNEALSGRGGDPAIVNDTTYDVHFYHLDLEIAIDSPYLSGNVGYIVSSEVNGLSSLRLDLDGVFSIDSVSYPASGYSFADNVLTIQFANTYDQGEVFSFAVYYHGAPELAGGYKGLRYEKHDGNEPIIASLSTPYLAHTWWPCKDGTSDKADSTYIDITIQDTVINSLPVIAVSNGILEAVETVGNKKTFKWRHRYPVVPYYMMVAISNYDHFQQTFNGPGYAFPLDYYVFHSQLAAAQNGVAAMPDAMSFFTNTFGPYPFLEEKYGMTQLGYYGAIENQTNTIINKMDAGWLYVSVHELAHQWFADMITCSNWHHGWLNEGFASYAEALYAEHTGGFAAYQSYMGSFEFFNPGTLYLYDVSNPFSGVFQSIIYDKGAYVLHMLRGVLGDAAFFDALHTYATSSDFQYKHATTEDFQAICESVSGLDLDYFFEEWIYDERYPKYSYNYQFNAASGQLDINILQTQGGLGWREVFAMPMEIGIGFTDGTDTTVTVFNNSQFQYLSFSFEKKVVSVALDPDKWILREVQYNPDLPVDTKELALDQIAIYPNPGTGVFWVNIPSGLFREDLDLKLFDLSGKLRYHLSPAAGPGGGYEIEIDNLEEGIYLLQLSAGSIQISRKIAVVK